MRILHVSDCYAPRTGGIESQVRDLARAQSAEGHDVHVLTATPGPAGERRGTAWDGGVRVHRLAARMPFDLPVNPAAPPRMRALLRDVEPDVVHVHAGVVSPFAYDGARVALDSGAATAITWHCMLDGLTPVLRAVVPRTRWSGAPVALSAVSGAAAARVAEAFGAEVAVVPNGVDLGRWTSRGGQGQRPPGPLRCVATMRLAPRKRGPALLDVVADAVGCLGPDALTLEVIGDGPDRRRMARRVTRRGLDDVVTLHGRLDRDRVPAVYEGADVFVAPAVLEAFGIAALEARAAGLVVVARRGTGIEEFVRDGVDGVLADDDAGMARALVHLATHPDALAAMAGRARDDTPSFDWSRTVAAAGEEYARAVAMRR